MTITGRRGRLARISSRSCRPLRPGMRISVTSTSGSSRRNALSTASDSSNNVVLMPPCLSARSSTQRIEASSSTTQTLSMFAEPVVVEGQQDREHGAPGPTLELDQAVVAADEVLSYGEAKAGAARAPRHERIEDRVLELRWNARSVVFNLDAGDDAVAAAADARIGERARAQHDSTLRAHGLHGVSTEVQERLDDEIPVKTQPREARIVVALDLHGAGRLGRQQMANMLYQFVDVERLLAGLLSRTEQRIDETREAIGLGDDDRCVLMQRAVLELAFEQLRGAAEPAQRIADLVRELTHHRPAAAELSQECILAHDALVLSHVRDLDQYASRPTRLIEGTDRHVDNALGRARMAGDVQLTARVWRRGAACPLDERLELLVVAQEILERASAERVPADAEQVLGGLVEVQHGTFAV